MINENKMERLDNLTNDLWIELEYVHQHYKCLGKRIKDLELLRGKMKEIIHEDERTKK